MPERQLTESQVAELQQDRKPRRYRRGETIFHQGDPSTHAVLILQGHVKVAAVRTDGRESVFDFRGPGCIVGEFAAVDSRPRSAKVTAVEPVDAVVIPAPELKDFLKGNPEFTLSLLEAAIRSLRAADRQRLEIGGATARERVLLGLVDLAEDEDNHEQTGQGVRINLRITQEELAGWVDVSRVAVSRELRRLRERKIVKTGRRSILIRDLTRLRVELAAARDKARERRSG